LLLQFKHLTQARYQVKSLLRDVTFVYATQLGCNDVARTAPRSIDGWRG